MWTQQYSLFNDNPVRALLYNPGAQIRGPLLGGCADVNAIVTGPKDMWNKGRRLGQNNH